jgi:putative chitinase
MSTITVQQIKKVMPKAKDAWAMAAIAEMPKWGIDTPSRISYFLGQASVESNQFTIFDEVLYYTNPDRVRALFSRYFDPLDVDDAWGYLQQPERFANRVYANRFGNGDEASGDGWRYRGGGIFQLTFRDNYIQMGKLIRFDLMNKPEAIRQNPIVGCASACAYWQSRDCNELADVDNVEEITKRINAAKLELDERTHIAHKFSEILTA